MQERAYILVKDLINDFKLEVVIAPDGFEEKKIYSSDMIRPGLQLAGFFEHFDPNAYRYWGA